MKQDWDKWGRDISNMVQDAVNSQNFTKLNQSISHTIQDAVDSFQKGMDKAGRSAGYAAEQAAEPWKQKVKQASKQPPKVLFAKVSTRQAGGTAMLVCGIVFGAVFGLGLLVSTLIGVLGGIFSVGVRVAGAVLIPFLIGSILMGMKGRSMSKETRRFQKYVELLRGKTCCNIAELADRTGKSGKYVLKDVRKMIRKGWFLEGHLDDENTCLMVSHETYEAYEELKQRQVEQKRLQELEEGQTKAGQKQMKGGSGEEKCTDGLPPETAKVIEEGNAYIRKIHACNDAIPGEEISRKISRMEMLVRRIFERVEQTPEAVDDIRKLMVYYLPTTVKLLEAYAQLDAQPVSGENIRASKLEIEQTLDTLNIAFEKLLDSLFEDVAWDVSSDISVLQTMLAQEGLTGNDFERKE